MPETEFLKPNRNLINNLPNIMHFKCTKVASLKDITFITNDQISQLQAPFKHLLK